MMKESVAEHIPRPVDEEDVVVHLHRYAESLKTATIDADMHKREMEQIHAEISACPCAHMYRQYKEGIIPNLEMLQRSIDVAIEVIDADSQSLNPDNEHDREDIASLDRTKKVLSSRVSEIQQWIRTYAETVVRFHQLKKLTANDTRDLRKQFERADHSRRRAHDALIETLRVTAHTLADVRDLLDDNDARKAQLVTLGDNILRDRDLVRDWALAADFHTQLQLVRERAAAL